ncbi:isochorismate synthase [Cyanobacterium aponinum]|uniref:isochorismate synthase n=1 Tax=Cyanobacterium aponinum TaxID=379064 RepID=UPI000C12D3AA|nr:isochorismate synthase [Cyanobacterium aponinum]PHV62602.1 isochorismate synthase [Cyanobacterium aponinum IPPAS B-1201]
MAIIPNHLSVLDYIQEFKKLIFSSSFNIKNNSSPSPIFSISCEVEPIDPLIFISVLQTDKQPVFYWQNQRKKEAIAAIGAIKSLNIDKNICQQDKNIDRFQKCQEFINNNQKLIHILNKDQDNYQPHFFTYFRFFEQSHNFDNKSFPLATIFLPFIQLIKKDNKYSVTINTYNQNKKEILDYLKDNFSEKIELNYKVNYSQENKINSHLENAKYQGFIDKVNKGLEAIKSEKLTKIVVAHALEIKTENKFNIVKSLENLRNNHPDCYIFSIGNEDQEYFIGASPERLLSIKDNQLVSDALAGSAPRGKNEDEDFLIGNNLLDSEKEKREHQAVSNFIFNQLSAMGLQPKKASLQLLKLSNIQHLWTPIYAEIKEEINPLEIVRQLHPTPAVAGVPIEVACQEIETSEKFDRSLYAAPIGWLDLQGNCEFIVGIRSALIKENYARLYAGAGIVTGSKPEQELTEIKLKFQALLQALI